jgi:hypothetical protein
MMCGGSGVVLPHASNLNTEKRVEIHFIRRVRAFGIQLMGWILEPVCTNVKRNIYWPMKGKLGD